jgi:hypothetical protein
MIDVRKSDFRLLKNWKVRRERRCRDKGKVCFDIRRKKATIYVHEEPVPEDFFLHEYLHVALQELLSIRKGSKKAYDSEEILIQDICRIVRDKEQFGDVSTKGSQK